MKVLKFGAVWCADCLVMRPMWQEVEKQIPGFETEYYDADESPDALKKYKVKNIPECIFLDQDGQEIFRLQGIQNKEDILKAVKENLDK